MVANKVARRYAKSLLLLAQERNELDAVMKEMAVIKRVIDESKDLRVFLKSPVIGKEKKVEILNKIYAGELGAMVQGFVTIITKNNRESILHDIAAAFEELYNEVNKVVSAEVTSAVELSDNVLAKVKSIVSVIDHNEVKIRTKVDPKLIGGVVVRVGDSQVDASVARELREIKKELTSKDYQVKL
jgi:F-type H+-transporting ATPase subunit delta